LFLRRPADGLTIIVFLLIGAAIAATLGFRYRTVIIGAMVIAIGAAAYAGGPTLLAGGLGLAAIGWRKKLTLGLE
jgi:hypothetical protein